MRPAAPLLVLALVSGLVHGAEDPPDAKLAINRGLEFLAKDALAWKNERKCASCHHAPMAIWTLNEASKLGFGGNEQAVAELSAWIIAKDDPAKVFPNQAPQDPIVVNQSPLMLALGLGARNAQDEASQEGLKKTLATLVGQQRLDGSWGLQSPWEPIGSTPEVMTTLALLALNSPTAPDLGPEGRAAREKGLAWLSSSKTEETVQSVALKLVLWRRLGRPAAEQEPLLKSLLSWQNPDGGWSQTKELPSDAYATGQSLYALAEAGFPQNDPAVERAEMFLLKSQQPNGSWAMSSRPNPRDGKSAKNLEPITYSGSAWAVLGLMRAAPPPKSQ
jgi:hypothetical protein